MIALQEAYRAGLLRRQNWLPNVISGLVVGVVALPLAMAFAIASGAKPEQGLYTAIVAGLLVSAFGGSRMQIAGPTGAFIVILSGVTAAHGIDGLQIATLMAGIILVGMGAARLGTVIKFIPAPVIVGFTTGIGVIIWVGQWPDFFGLPKPSGAHFHDKLWHTLQALPHLHPATTALAIASLLLVILTPRFARLKRVPGPLVAMVVVTALQATFHFDGVATIGSTFGGLPQGLPNITLPNVTMTRVVELVGPAFTIAMLGAIESLLSAVVADGMAGTRQRREPGADWSGACQYRGAPLWRLRGDWRDCPYGNEHPQRREQPLGRHRARADAGCDPPPACAVGVEGAAGGVVGDSCSWWPTT